MAREGDFVRDGDFDLDGDFDFSGDFDFDFDGDDDLPRSALIVVLIVFSDTGFGCTF